MTKHRSKRLSVGPSNVTRAAKAGRPLILDQTIAHPRAKHLVYEKIKKQFPNWADDLEVRAETVSAAEELEHRQAAKIVVASSFTKRTLVENGVPENKIVLNPYGVDLERFLWRLQEVHPCSIRGCRRAGGTPGGVRLLDEEDSPGLERIGSSVHRFIGSCARDEIRLDEITR